MIHIEHARLILNTILFLQLVCQVPYQLRTEANLLLAEPVFNSFGTKTLDIVTLDQVVLADVFVGF